MKTGKRIDWQDVDGDGTTNTGNRSISSAYNSDVKHELILSDFHERLPSYQKIHQKRKLVLSGLMLLGINDITAFKKVIREYGNPECLSMKEEQLDKISEELKKYNQQ